MSKNPVVPHGYDQEERWAHEENQKKLKALKEKADAEKKEAGAVTETATAAADDEEPGLHHRYYGADSEPDSDD